MEFMDLGGPVMWIILGLSVLGGAIVLERFWFISRASTDAPSLELSLWTIGKWATRPCRSCWSRK